jgi:hypothetical protein
MNKGQTARAMQILAELNEIAPDLITFREAADICNRYGVTNTKFHRCAKRDKNCRPTNLAQVAVVIAQKAA